MKTLKLNPLPPPCRLLLLLWAILLGAGPAASAQTPRLFLDPGGHTSIVRQVLYTPPDGKYVISVGNDKSIRVWDAATGKEVGSPIYGQVGDDSRGQLLAAALDPAGKLLAVAGRTYVGAVGSDATKNRFVIRLFRLDDLSARPLGVALLKLLPGADDNSAEGHGDTIFGLAFSPDGQRLASCSADTTVHLWDLRNGGCKRLGGGPIYDPDHQSPNDHTASVTCIAWSPDGRQIASGSADQSVRIWDTSSGDFQKSQDIKESVRCLAWSPRTVDNGQTLLIGTMSEDKHRGSLFAWNLQANRLKRLSQQDHPVSCVAYSPDGQRVALGQDVGGSDRYLVHVWPVAQIGDSAAGRSLSHESAVQSVAFAPAGGVLVSGTNNGDLFEWSLADASAPARRLGGSSGAITDIAWSGDGKRLRWKSGGQTFVYDLDQAYCRPDEGKGAWSGPLLADSRGHTLAPTSDGHAVAFSGHADLSFPNLPADQNDPAYADYVTGETLTRDGKGVIVGSNFHLRLYRASDGQLLHQFIGHTASVLSVAVSPDGKYLASASGDQTVRLWSLAAEPVNSESNGDVHPILSIFADAQRNYVAWADRGFYACSPKGQSMIGWQRNQGDEAKASYDLASGFPMLRRPDVVMGLWKHDGDIVQTLDDPDIHAPDTNVSDIKPPRVDSLTVKQGQGGAETLQISARLTPGSNPLDFVKVAVNGHVQKMVSLGDLSQAGGDKAFVRTWTLDHLKGLSAEAGQDNLISVTAYDKPKEDTAQPAQSQPALVSCTLPPPVPHKPRLNLLVIGVRRYRKFLDLLYPDKDALAIRQEFEAQEGDGKLFDKGATFSLVNKQATQGNIIATLDKLKAAPQDESDYTVVFVAGHGGQTDAKHYYFLPYDVDTSVDADTLKKTAISWDDFYSRLSGLPGHVLVFLDTCHSAGAKETQADAPTNAQTNNLAYRELLAELATDADSDTSAVITVASCDAGQTSQELAKYQHGAFAEALLEGLQAENNAAHPNAKHQVTLGRLYNYIAQKVPAITGDIQYPPLPLAKITPEINDLPLAQTTPQAASR